MPRTILLSLALAACAAPDEPDPTDGTPGTSADPLALTGMSAAVRFSVDTDRITDLLAFDDGSLGVLTVQELPGEYCPECEEEQLGDDCPSECAFEDLSYQVWDDTGTSTGPPTVLRRYFPPDTGYHVGSAQMTALSGSRLGVAWQLCGPAPTVGCGAEYGAFAADGSSGGPIASLGAEQFGDLQVLSDPDIGEVLVVRGSAVPSRLGVWVTLLDELGNTRLEWTRAGSSGARNPAAVATGAGFQLVAHDPDDDAADADCPLCATQTECTTEHGSCSWGGAPDADSAGLHTWSLTTVGLGERLQVATGWGDDGTYRDHELVAAAWEDGLRVAAWWRSGESLGAWWVADGVVEPRLDAWMGRDIPLSWLALAAGSETLALAEASDPTADGLLPRTFAAATDAVPEGTPEARFGSYDGWTEGATVTRAPDRPGVIYVAGDGEDSGRADVLELGALGEADTGR